MKRIKDSLSGAYRMNPDGASESTMQVITVFAASKHCAESPWSEGHRRI